MDGELDRSEAGGIIDRVLREDEAREHWAIYHLISDAFRCEYLLSRDLRPALVQRLAAEPTVLAPRAPSVISRFGKYALSAAASVAAIVAVGWLALAPNSLTTDSISPGVATVSQRGSAAPAMRPAALDGSVRAYLFAHQEYSPTTQIQGVAPYVRTVAEVPNTDSR